VNLVGYSAIDLLNQGLDDLSSVCQHLLEVVERETL